MPKAFSCAEREFVWSVTADCQESTMLVTGKQFRDWLYAHYQIQLKAHRREVTAGVWHWELDHYDSDELLVMFKLTYG